MNDRVISQSRPAFIESHWQNQAPESVLANAEGPEVDRGLQMASAMAEVVSKSKSGDDHEIDLALSKELNAADFQTGSGRKGGTVRNIMSLEQGRAAGIIHSNQGLSGKEICDLIKGRDYLTIIVGKGADAQTIVFRNDAHDKNNPGALAICNDGESFEPWIATEAHADAKQGGLLKLAPQSRIVLHAQTHIETHRPAPADPKAASKVPFFHQLQCSPRATTSGLHAANHAIGKEFFNNASWNSTLARIRNDGMDQDDADETMLPQLNPEQPSTIGKPDVTSKEVFTLLQMQYANGDAGFRADVNGYGADFRPEGQKADADDSILNHAATLENTDNIHSIVLGTPDHFVTFRKCTVSKQWILIDSKREDQPHISPTGYLNALGPSQRESASLIAIRPTIAESAYMHVHGTTVTVSLNQQQASSTPKVADSLSDPQGHAALTTAQVLAAFVTAAGTKTGQEVDLALAMEVGACDFNTTPEGKPREIASSGNSVRNVMTIEQGRAVGMFEEPQGATLQGKDLCNLIGGREFMTLLVPEGAGTLAVVIRNCAADKSRPKVGDLQMANGNAFEQLDLGRLSGPLGNKDTRIVLHQHLQNATYVSKDDADQGRGLYHERQKKNEGFEAGFMRRSTCPVHSINHILGGPVLTQHKFDSHVIEKTFATSQPDSAQAGKKDFYLNVAVNQYHKVDGGVSAEMVKSQLEALLGERGKVQLVEPAYLEKSISFEAAQDVEDKARKVILHTGDHFIAFIRSNGQWTLIDSIHPTQDHISPSDYTQKHGAVGLIYIDESVGNPVSPGSYEIDGGDAEPAIKYPEPDIAERPAGIDELQLDEYEGLTVGQSRTFNSHGGNFGLAAILKDRGLGALQILEFAARTQSLSSDVRIQEADSLKPVLAGDAPPEATGDEAMDARIKAMFSEKNNDPQAPPGLANLFSLQAERAFTAANGTLELASLLESYDWSVDDMITFADNGGTAQLAQLLSEDDDPIDAQALAFTVSGLNEEDRQAVPELASLKTAGLPLEEILRLVRSNPAEPLKDRVASALASANARTPSADGAGFAGLDAAQALQFRSDGGTVDLAEALNGLFLEPDEMLAYASAVQDLPQYIDRVGLAESLNERGSMADGLAELAQIADHPTRKAFLDFGFSKQQVDRFI